MAYLVTGGSGFLGSHLIRDLANRGEEVIGVDTVLRGATFGHTPKTVRLTQCDITSLEDLLAVSREFDVGYILHMAYLMVPNSERDLARAVKVNIEGMKNILELARHAGVKRVVWPSSIAVYGPSSFHRNKMVTEVSPTRPTSFYGACKVFNEEMGRHYDEVYGVKNIALRYGSVYGPGRSRGFSAFMVELIEKPAVGEPVTIDLGDELLNWVYITDAVRAAMAALTRKNIIHNVYNITGSVRSVREVAACVKRLLPNSEIELKPGRTRRQVHMDGRRASRELNYEPKYTMEKGVREHINKVRAQHGFSPV